MSGGGWAWSERKNEVNRLKHSLSFETAKLAFADPLALSVADPHEGEVRWRTFGMVSGILLLVIHTEPTEIAGGFSTPGRIISARKATKSERRAYEDCSL